MFLRTRKVYLKSKIKSIARCGKGGESVYKKYVQLRDERGVTDYEVAKKAGISPSSLSNWKAGRYKPKVDKLKKIADYFGVTLEVLIAE